MVAARSRRSEAEAVAVAGVFLLVVAIVFAALRRPASAMTTSLPAVVILIALAIGGGSSLGPLGSRPTPSSAVTGFVSNKPIDADNRVDGLGSPSLTTGKFLATESFGVADDTVGAAPGKPAYPPNRGFEFDPIETTLKPGSSINRYGARGGTFASPKGTPFGQRALPPSDAYKPYEAYEVLKPIEGVRMGPVRPWFGQPGRGVQYEFPRSIQELIDDRFLGVKK